MKAVSECFLCSCHGKQAQASSIEHHDQVARNLLHHPDATGRQCLRLRKPQPHTASCETLQAEWHRSAGHESHRRLTQWRTTRPVFPANPGDTKWLPTRPRQRTGKCPQGRTQTATLAQLPALDCLILPFRAPTALKPGVLANDYIDCGGPTQPIGLRGQKLALTLI